MAFITIRKNDKVLRIPKGAYNKMYAPAGWELENDFQSQIGANASLGEESIANEFKSETAMKYGTGEAQDTTPNDEIEEDTEISEIEELEEKPLSELSVPELRALAEHKGIDITGLTSAKRLRDAIKNA